MTRSPSTTPVIAWLLVTTAMVSAEVRDIGSRRELFVDDFLIERMHGVTQRLHHPQPREVAIVFDAPWEGNTSAYVTVFKDEDRYRMYYRGSHYDPAAKKQGGQRVCYAESTDGVHWARPVLNLYEFEGSKKNNIVWTGTGAHNFAPFRDKNPDCKRDARYKALGSGKGLFAFKSPDGIRWSPVQEEPVITKGKFDSQNLAFWDALRGRYVDFHRGFRNGVRDIMTCTSQDFVNWTEPRYLDWGTTPPEHLYTNAITPYFRAPHLFVGFPKRFAPSRQVGHHPQAGVSDGVFMCSRDGVRWHRWREAFIRPGPQASRWVNRNNMTAWGILVHPSPIPGAPDELSFYSSEGYYVGPCRMRRYALRMDGFVSVHAGMPGGELLTRPLVFDGTKLTINCSTSGSGGIRVELQGRDGTPIDGHALDDATEIFGDSIDRTVTWKSGADVSALAGKPVRLRFVMNDADLYAIQFQP